MELHDKQSDVVVEVLQQEGEDSSLRFTESDYGRVTHFFGILIPFALPESCMDSKSQLVIPPYLQVKIVVVGDAAVGKSALIAYFADGKFDPFLPTTMGLDFRTKQVDAEQKILVTIMDTAGQERFRSLTSMFYKKAQAIMVVYDCTNKTSFDSVHYWVSQVNNHTVEKLPMILVGNKCEDQQRCVIPTEQALALAAMYQIDFLECSAKTGKNVAEAFLHLVKKVAITRSVLAGASPIELGKLPEKEEANGCRVC